MPDEVYIDSKAPNAETQWLLMNEKVKNAQNTAAAETAHLKEVTLLHIQQLDIRIAHEKEVVTLIKHMGDKAVDQVEVQAKEYRAAQNEWRGALSDSAERKADIASVLEVLKRVEKLEQEKSSQIGRLQLLQYIPWVIAALALIYNVYRNSQAIAVPR